MPVTTDQHRSTVTGRVTGSVLAVVTDGPDDLAVTDLAIAEARRTSARLILVVPLEAFQYLGDRRLRGRLNRVRRSDASAIVARVLPRLSTTGVPWTSTQLVLPTQPATSRARHAGSARLGRLADLHGAHTVVTSPRAPAGLDPGTLVSVLGGRRPIGVLTATALRGFLHAPAEQR